MKVEKLQAEGFEAALRGMRNPLDSWNKSDSAYDYIGVLKEYCQYTYRIGPNDMNLAHRLISAGPEHCKFLRQIQISMDITAPLYWWKEFDTYKVGTTANSCSTMHTLAKHPITIDCFETGDYNEDLPVKRQNQSGVNPKYKDTFEAHFHMGDEVDRFIEALEDLRMAYIETGEKQYWKELVRWLPNSWLQKRTITMNYAVLRNIIKQRQNHKLSEWHTFIDAMKELPYAEELIFYGLEDKEEN